MCGIVGIFHLDTPKPVSRARIEMMMAAQAHRGPDARGSWTASGVGFGHCRLAVIDPMGSAQPMHSADGQLSVTFNGEIYNYRALRAELERLGHGFKTDGDTEVLIHGYRQWGVNLLPRLDGIFAFALYDARAQSLFLARDRLGVKPLHYVLLGDGSLAFASELKGLLSHPACRRTINLQAIEDYFSLGYIPDDACFFAGVQKLAAGHMLLLQRGQAMPRPTCWWDVDFSGRDHRPANALEEELRELLQRAVASRMVADVPLGAFLSGGLDSSTIVALMSEMSARPVKSFTIGFGASPEDESVYARQVAQRFGAEAAERQVAAEDVSYIDQLSATFDEPFADASALPMLPLAQMAREKVTVALSGDGADEIFAGYRRHRSQVAEESLRQLLPDTLRRTVFGGVGAIYPKADWAPRMVRAKRTLQALGLSEGEAYGRSVGMMVPEDRARLFRPALLRELQGYRAEERYDAVMRHAPARNALDRAQYADIKIWLPGDILTKLDRTSMAVGLEVREPMLDHRLVEFAARLPSRLRLHRGEGKRLLKRVMAGHLPADIIKRPKQGFVPPLAQWFRGAVGAQARALSTSSCLVESGWFQPEYIQQVVSAHQAGKTDHGRLLWQLLVFEGVLQHHLNRGSAPR